MLLQNTQNNYLKGEIVMSFCSKCGAKLNEGDRFCFDCGETVSNNANSRKAEFDGEVHKCPKCGGTLNSFVTICPSCGYELRGVKIANRVNELSIKLQNTKSIEQKSELISNFYIPNTKEDIYEFFILASSNISTGGDATDAWSTKLEQAYQKARLVFGNTPEFKSLEDLYIKGNKKQAIWSIVKNIKLYKNVIITVIGILMMIIGFFAGDASGNSDSPFYMLTLVGMLVAMLGVGSSKTINKK